jgi:hypothetical protein
MRDKMKITIYLNLSAWDWSLSTDKPHPESVARQINLEISRAINESTNWFDAFALAEKTLFKFEHYGANAAGARAVLDKILTYIYRDE